MVRCAIHPYDGAVAVTCPKCKQSSMFSKGPLPFIDRCVSNFITFAVSGARAIWPESLTPSTMN
jgi:hypothetical protein